MIRYFIFPPRSHFKAKSSIWRSRSICLILASFLLIGFTQSSKAGRQCEQAIERKDEIVQGLPLESSAGLVKDLYRALPFPRVKFQSARPIDFTEVAQILESFYSYTKASEKFAVGLPELERELLQEAAVEYRTFLYGFVKSYTSFEPTSLILERLILLSNRIKGRSFEALIAILLVRSKFTDIAVGQSGREILNAKLKSKIYHSEDFEVDIFARKDGQLYLVEVKSIKSLENKYLEQELKMVGIQIAKRDRVLTRTKIRDGVKILVIQHFSLGEDIRKAWLRQGADAVFYIRKKFLDDFNSYEIPKELSSK